MELFVFGIMAAALSALFALAIRKLFSRPGNWLAVALATLIPPLCFVPIGVFGLLSDIGAAAQVSGQGPPNMINNFASELNLLLAKGAIWIVVALPVSLSIVRWHRRRTLR